MFIAVPVIIRVLESPSKMFVKKAREIENQEKESGLSRKQNYGKQFEY